METTFRTTFPTIRDQIRGHSLVRFSQRRQLFVVTDEGAWIRGRVTKPHREGSNQLSRRPDRSRQKEVRMTRCTQRKSMWGDKLVQMKSEGTDREEEEER